MRFRRWIHVSAVTLLIGVTAAGCDDVLSPASDFDASEAAQAMESMVGAVETQELEYAFRSLEAVGGVLQGGTAALLAEPVSADPAVLAGMREVEAAADVLPPEYLGTTFEWSEMEQAYVPSDAAGAPEDGIRVIYYAIDPVSDQPASPLNALGQVDLRDLSTMESDRLGVKVVRYGDPEVTLADYYLDLAFTITQSSFSLAVEAVGYLADGTDQLNFDVAHGLSAAESEVSITQAYSLDLEGTDNAITFTASATADPQSQSEDPETMDAQATITSGSETVVLDIRWADDTLDGTVSHNGAEAVLIGGTLDEPEFTDANGEPLTEDQIAALQQVWESIGEMFEFVEGLFSWAE